MTITGSGYAIVSIRSNVVPGVMGSSNDPMMRWMRGAKASIACGVKALLTKARNRV